MTANQAPPAAVQIAQSVLWSTESDVATSVVAALAERYAFVAHAEYTRLVAVEKRARRTAGDPELGPVARAVAREILDAAPTGTTAEGD